MKPKVFINNISKDIKNNIDEYHFKNEDIVEVVKENVNVNEKLEEIFNSDLFVYKYDALIKLKNGSEVKEAIIALKDNEIITLNNNKIKVEDILDIKKAN